MEDARFRHECNHIVMSKTRNCLKFNGNADSYVECPSGYIFNETTLEFLINTSADTGTIFYAYGAVHYLVVGVSNSCIKVSVSVGGGPILLVGDIGIDDGKWHQIVVVSSPSTPFAGLYVDRVLDNSLGMTAALTCNVGVNFGKYGAFFYNGLIDSTRYYNRKWTPQELSTGIASRTDITAEWLMNEQTGNIAADSVSSNDGIIHGADWYVHSQDVKYKSHECPRCLGTGYYYDLKVTPTLNDVETVTGATKLGQELVKRTLELKEIQNIIGRVTEAEFLARFKAALTGVVNDTASSQKESFLLGGDYPDTELIDRVERIEVSQIEPRYYEFRISLVTRSGRGITIKDTIGKVTS